MKVIGITGTIGAGKGTVVTYLMEQIGFLHYSVRGFLVRQIELRGLPVNRDSMVMVANELRATHTPSYIIEALYRDAVSNGKDCVIESIRTPGEVVALRKVPHFQLLAIDADPIIRFRRIANRGSETDHIDFETFLANEAREMDSIDPNHQNIRKCIEMADITVSNNGTIEELHQKLSAMFNYELRNNYQLRS
jgi:dephospho-CoA kinase